MVVCFFLDVVIVRWIFTVFADKTNLSIQCYIGRAACKRNALSGARGEIVPDIAAEHVYAWPDILYKLFLPAPRSYLRHCVLALAGINFRDCGSLADVSFKPLA